ncbi:uncharacterized protein LOC113793409 [Dermatophagoides pteronyssinus]|uniref:uncharacterized protein LOC113793409 n=1 Tax=Dermatophagoides pteronyssinus TaxID=6956 RepID=UPI003F66E19F
MNYWQTMVNEQYDHYLRHKQHQKPFQSQQIHHQQQQQRSTTTNGSIYYNYENCNNINNNNNRQSFHGLPNGHYQHYHSGQPQQQQRLGSTSTTLSSALSSIPSSGTSTINSATSSNNPINHQHHLHGQLSSTSFTNDGNIMDLVQVEVDSPTKKSISSITDQIVKQHQQTNNGSATIIQRMEQSWSPQSSPSSSLSQPTAEQCSYQNDHMGQSQIIINTITTKNRNPLKSILKNAKVSPPPLQQSNAIIMTNETTKSSANSHSTTTTVMTTSDRSQPKFGILKKSTSPSMQISEEISISNKIGSIRRKASDNDYNNDDDDVDTSESISLNQNKKSGRKNLLSFFLRGGGGGGKNKCEENNDIEANPNVNNYNNRAKKHSITSLSSNNSVLTIDGDKSQNSITNNNLTPTNIRFQVDSPTTSSSNNTNISNNTISEQQQQHIHHENDDLKIIQKEQISSIALVKSTDQTIDQQTKSNSTNDMLKQSQINFNDDHKDKNPLQLSVNYLQVPSSSLQPSAVLPMSLTSPKLSTKTQQQSTATTSSITSVPSMPASQTNQQQSLPTNVLPSTEQPPRPKVSGWGRFSLPRSSQPAAAIAEQSSNLHRPSTISQTTPIFLTTSPYYMSGVPQATGARVSDLRKILNPEVEKEDSFKKFTEAVENCDCFEFNLNNAAKLITIVVLLATFILVIKALKGDR